MTVDNVMEELRSMKGRILPTQEGRDIVLGAQKNELNMLMAKAFGLSLTKQFLKMDALEKPASWQKLLQKFVAVSQKPAFCRTF